MKRIFQTYVSLGLLAALTGGVQAQTSLGGTFLISSDLGGSDCTFYDLTPGTFSVNVLLAWHLGVTGARFRVVQSEGVTLTYMSETPNPTATVVGNSLDGITICIPCNPAPVLLTTIHYLAAGTSETCSVIEAARHPDAATLETIDCLNDTVWTPGCRQGYVNPDIFFCGCHHQLPAECEGVPGVRSTSEPFNFCTVPVNESTWGRIKALFN